MTADELKAMRDKVYERFNETGDGGFKDFHKKAARAYRECGKIEDAQAAEKLARKPGKVE